MRGPRHHRQIKFVRQPEYIPSFVERDWGASIIMLILMRHHGPMSCTVPYHVIHDWEWIDLLVRAFGDKTGEVLCLARSNDLVCCNRYRSEIKGGTLVLGFVRIHDPAVDWDIVSRVVLHDDNSFRYSIDIPQGVGIIRGQHHDADLVLCPSFGSSIPLLPSIGACAVGRTFGIEDGEILGIGIRKRACKDSTCNHMPRMKNNNVIELEENDINIGIGIV